MARLTLCMIARDEAEMLPDCLQSVKDVVDEMIVVDTGSQDRTVPIAEALGARVVHHPWSDDFSAARNAALPHATGDWILVLDADERLAAGAGEALRAAMTTDGMDCGMLPLHDATRLDAPHEEVLSGAARIGDPVLLPRLLRRTEDLRWEGVVHESPRTWIMSRGGGAIAQVAAPIIHLGAVPTLREQRDKAERNRSLLERQVELTPDDPMARSYLASELKSVGRMDEAMTQARAAWTALLERLDRGEPWSAITVATQLLVMLLGKGQIQEAVEVIERARALPADHPNLDLLEGVCFEALARTDRGARDAHLTRARDRLMAAMSRHGEVFADALLPGVTTSASAQHLGLVLLQQGEPAAALEAFGVSLQGGKGVEAELGRAEALIDLGRPAEALPILEPLLQADLADAWLLAADAARTLGARDDARSMLTRANEVMSTSGLAAAHRRTRATTLLAWAGRRGRETQFQITVIDPDGYRFGHFLHDIIKILCASIESLGYSCVIARNRFSANRVNVVVGAHLIQDPALLSQVAGLDYIVYQSEVIRHDGINLSRDKERLEKVYIPFLQGANAVWDGTRSNLPELAHFGIDARWLQPGFHPCLKEIHHKRKRDIDFLFYGSTTEHRVALFQALQKRGHQVVVVFDPSALYRNDLIARTKLHLVPRQGAGMNQLPYWRIVYQLHNGCIPIVEQCNDMEWLSDCFLWSDTDGYLDLCTATLARTDLDEVAQALCERFAQTPIHAHLEPLVAEVLGLESGSPT